MIIKLCFISILTLASGTGPKLDVDTSGRRVGPPLFGIRSTTPPSPWHVSRPVPYPEPGHRLLVPRPESLKSQVHFPIRDPGERVYGHEELIGPMYEGRVRIKGSRFKRSRKYFEDVFDRIKNAISSAIDHEVRQEQLRKFYSNNELPLLEKHEIFRNPKHVKYTNSKNTDILRYPNYGTNSAGEELDVRQLLPYSKSDLYEAILESAMDENTEHYLAKDYEKDENQIPHVKFHDRKSDVDNRGKSQLTQKYELYDQLIEDRFEKEIKNYAKNNLKNKVEEADSNKFFIPYYNKPRSGIVDVRNKYEQTQIQQYVPDNKKYYRKLKPIQSDYESNKNSRDINRYSGNFYSTLNKDSDGVIDYIAKKDDTDSNVKRYSSQNTPRNEERHKLSSVYSDYASRYKRQIPHDMEMQPTYAKRYPQIDGPMLGPRRPRREETHDIVYRNLQRAINRRYASESNEEWEKPSWERNIDNDERQRLFSALSDIGKRFQQEGKPEDSQKVVINEPDLFPPNFVTESNDDPCLIRTTTTEEPVKSLNMTGDHMNIFPEAPIWPYPTVDPPIDDWRSRDWWYYNQDDYIPFKPFLPAHVKKPGKFHPYPPTEKTNKDQGT